jgi:hypothetical protein
MRQLLRLTSVSWKPTLRLTCSNSLRRASQRPNCFLSMPLMTMPPHLSLTPSRPLTLLIQPLLLQLQLQKLIPSILSRSSSRQSQETKASKRQHLLHPQNLLLQLSRLHPSQQLLSRLQPPQLSQLPPQLLPRMLRSTPTFWQVRTK